MEKDPGDMLGSVIAFPEQCADGWAAVNALSLPEEYAKAKNIVVAGMGGSALGTHIIETAFADKLSLPINRVQQYKLPAYVDEDTLVIASSYSGTTEETVTAYEEAKKKTKKIIGLATGGAIMERCVKDGFPVATFDPKRNPSGQPRSALGYAVAAQLALFTKLGLLDISDSDIEGAIEHTKKMATGWTPESDEDTNTATMISKNYRGKIPLLVCGPQLTGCIHALTNQTNETAKRFAAYFEIPELNHHLLEGLAHPHSNGENLLFVFFESPLYHPRVQKRFIVMKNILSEFSMPWITYTAESNHILHTVFEVLQLGSFVAYYAAIDAGENPTPVPWVTLFKQQLEK